MGLAIGSGDVEQPVLAMTDSNMLAWCSNAGLWPGSYCRGIMMLLSPFPKKWAKPAGNNGVSPRSSVRLKGTCFLVGPWDEHLWLILVRNGDVLWHVWEHCQSISCKLPSPWIPTAGAADEVCLKSGAIAPLCGVGMVGLEMVRYTCGVLWKPMEVPCLLVACWCSGDWLWCCCAQFGGHGLFDRESPLGYLATSFFLVSAESDLAQDEEQAHECLLP